MTKSFKLWLNEDVDDSAIIRAYDKARIAVNLVKKYRPQVFQNISVISNLASGAYGVFTHFEIDDGHSGLVRGKPHKAELNQIPKQMIQQAHPGINPALLEKGEAIKINIQRILNDPKINSDLEAVIQIASTIIHESVHEMEVREKGTTSEVGPQAAEKEFVQFCQRPEIRQEIIDSLNKYPATSRKVKNRLY